MLGERVTHVARILYEHGGEIGERDGALEIRTDSRTLLLDGASDGESLRLRAGAWHDPFEHPLSDENRRYVEQHGRWVRVDCSELERYSELLGKELVEVVPLLNEHGSTGGLRLAVRDRTLWFVVEGDEGHVYWAPPPGFTT